MGRDALDISVSPAQNFLKPPPVPDTPTVTRTSGLAAMNSSAIASEMGKTVLDPSTLTSPLRSDEPPVAAVVSPAAGLPSVSAVVVVPQAVTLSVKAVRAARHATRFGRKLRTIVLKILYVFNLAKHCAAYAMKVKDRLRIQVGLR